MPFGEYRDFDDCVAQNADKDDPAAYCASIEQTMKVRVAISKISDEQRMWGGWAYVAKTADGTVVEDHSGDVVDTPEAWAALEKAFTDYALESRAGDDAHTVFGAADLVEMFISTPEKRAQLGIPDGTLPDGVFVSFKAAATPEGDALWAKVKSGEYRALSIVGAGRREAI